MKQKLYVFYFLVAIFFSLVACKPSAKKESDDKKSNSYYADDSLIFADEDIQIAEFKSFIQDLDSTDAVSASLVLERYKSVFKDQRPGLCDTAFVVLQSVIDTIELKLNEKLYEDTTDFSPLFLNETVPPKIAKFNNTLRTNGFELQSSEGYVYVSQNRTFVLTQISDMISDELKAYLTQIELENREGFVEDASIIITPNQHVDRILWYESFVKAHPNFILIENCKSYQKAYFTYLLVGFDNTRLYENEENMILNTYYSNAYKYLLKTYPESETAQLLKPYYNAIKQAKPIIVKDLIKKYVIKGLIFDMY
jgi:hypothetical protein